MRRTLIAASMLFIAHPAYAAGVAIATDEVRTITFPKPVATVYVGNPAIAEINLIDPRHAFILGRGYGNTNIVALDHAGDEVANTPVSVMARQNSTLTLQRGILRLTYNCTSSHCEVAPEPGDSKDVFDPANSENETHQNDAKGVAAAH